MILNTKDKLQFASLLIKLEHINCLFAISNDRVVYYGIHTATTNRTVIHQDDSYSCWLLEFFFSLYSVHQFKSEFNLWKTLNQLNWRWLHFAFSHKFNSVDSMNGKSIYACTEDMHIRFACMHIHSTQFKNLCSWHDQLASVGFHSNWVAERTQSKKMQTRILNLDKDNQKGMFRNGKS